MRTYLPSLARVSRGMALPYGYTITIWTSGAILSHYRGLPGIGDVFLFLGGAVLAFALVGLSADTASTGSVSPDRRELIRAGALELLAIVPAVGAVVAVAQLSSSWAWIMGGFAATLIHLLAAGFELWLAEKS